ncbi:ATP-dependent nuclease [Nocardia cyriacigeorgica]|uniref:DUF2813 domain-containing protein n=1 Tax=Nocardia cyriacigeorgica TaxID=135487 RepID=A0A5R8N8I9_9NOCA|nr:AAA family ATPase [Nocardia cyriacigeorgica]MBF6094988.1 AAA family ATPase [Nocardia cyriacigeorgica]MBF6427463.1 AAA family ATPase [Nocardia cyriacigeorgica]TLF72012.1 DUF2813 domain-containing protein [Nocardia cyriacigeorgica]
MKLERLRVSGFRCVGSESVELSLEEATFLLGPNGAGKTTFLHALARMFGSEASLRRFVRGDFHVPAKAGHDATVARSLWLEADFIFPELDELDSSGSIASSTVPPHFAHMRMTDNDGKPRVRFRLTGHLDENGEITDELVYVLAVDDQDEPSRTAVVNRHDRGTIQVHYLPARRDPADHVSYASSSLLGRLMRAANWQSERATVSHLGKTISDVMTGNVAISSVVADLAGRWGSLHTGSYLTSPALAFTPSEIEGILRFVTLEFAPGPGDPVVDYSVLSDGQQSLLYIALVMTAHAVGRSCLQGATNAFDIDVLRPPVFTFLAVEEPENSLSPHYLGRVLSALIEMTSGNDAQVAVATHSASLMRRVEPRQVRYLRLDDQRRTVVATVNMPATATEEYKFVREALHAYPEMYFARLVVLGEGDSEEIVIPRFLNAAGREADAASISVTPLGGRHVNHFWRLLNQLGIPHVTLLDLDLGRFQGGWGRIKYAAEQLLQFRPSGTLDFTAADIQDMHNRNTNVRDVDGRAWIERLETHGVYFSEPLDLDFAMLQNLPTSYNLTDSEKQNPDKKTIAAVLGANGSDDAYTEDEKLLFAAYGTRFKGRGGKPAAHVAALSDLKNSDLKNSMPVSITNLIERVGSILDGLPE